MDQQTIIAIITVVGSGVSVYVGVRVAIAELKAEISRLKEQNREQDARIIRLEDSYFRGHHSK